MRRGRALWFSMALALLGILLALGVSGTGSAAPYTSPGGGNSYNVSTLDVAAGGSFDPLGGGTCHYRVQGTITISAGDTLSIDAGCWFEFDFNQNLTILGRLLVLGNTSSPVLFDAHTGSPIPGYYGAVTFAGAAFAPSVVDNLTVQWSTFGLRCLACQNLTVRGLTVLLNTGDGVLVQGGASNITLQNITQTVTTYASQSVVGVNNASNINGTAVTGSGNADVLTLWNVTNARFSGGITGSGIVIAVAWIDNATNVSVLDLSGGPYPTGLRITRSSLVTVANSSISVATLAGINATVVDGLSVSNFTLAAGTAMGILLANVSNATLSGISLTTVSTALGLQGATNVSLDGLAATTAASALSVNRSTNIGAKNASLSGGAPATVWVNGSTTVSFSNVSTTGGAVGFAIVASSAVSLLSSSAFSAAGDGIQVSLSSSVSLNGTSVSASGGRGLNLTGAIDARVQYSNISGNGREGIWANASSFRVDQTTVSGNALDGIALLNASLLNATADAVESNGRYGLWVRGGTSSGWSLAVRRSGADGVQVESGALFLHDGIFENNTGLGINYSANASGGWSIAGGALLAYNGAVLVGGVSAAAGALTVLNATVDLRGSVGFPFLFAFGGSSALWLDRVTLEPATVASRFALSFAAGSNFTALRTTVASPGSSGNNPALLASGATLTLLNVSVQNPNHGLWLSASAGAFVDVTIAGAFAAGVALVSGSTLAAVRLQMSAGTGLTADASQVDLSDSAFLGITGAAITLTGGASLNATRLDINGSVAEGLVLSLSVADVSDSTFEGTGAAALSADASKFDLWNVTVTGSAADGLLAVNGSAVNASNFTVLRPAGDAVGVDGGTTVWLTDLLADHPGGDGVVASGGAAVALSRGTVIGGLRGASVIGANFTAADFTSDGAIFYSVTVVSGANADLTRATLVNSSIGLTTADAGRITLRDSFLSGAYAAINLDISSDVVLDGTTLDAPFGYGVTGTRASSLAATDLNISSGRDAVSLDSVPQASFLRLTIASGAGGLRSVGGTDFTLETGSIAAVTWGVWVATTANVVLANFTVTAGNLSAVEVDGPSNVTMRSGAATAASGAAGFMVTAPRALDLLDLDGTVGAGGTAFSIDGASGGSAGGLAAHLLGGGGAAGYSVTNSSLLSLDNLTGDGSGAFTGFSGLQLGNVTISKLVVAGGATGVLLQSSFAVTLGNSSVNGSLTNALFADGVPWLSVADFDVVALGTGLNLSACPNARLSRISVSGTTGAALLLDASPGGLVDTLFATLANGTGVKLTNSSGSTVRLATVYGGRTALSVSGSSAVSLLDPVVEGSQTAVYASAGASVNVSNATLRNLSVAGARADGGSAVSVWGSTIAGAPAAPTFAAASATGLGVIRLYDTAADNATFRSTPNGTVEVWWSLRFLVRDAGAPAPSTTVWLRDVSLTFIRAQVTDLAGLTPFALTLSLRDTGGARTAFEPFTVNASASAGWGGSVSFGLEGARTVTLGLSDTGAPSLEVRANIRVPLLSTVRFLPDPGDGDNVGITRYEWSFLNETGSPVTLAGQSAAYAFSAYGVYAVTVSAFDAAGNHNERTFQVLVNSPPFFLHPPGIRDLVGLTGVLFSWSFVASDNDSADIPGLTYTLVDGPPGSSMAGFELRWTPSVAESYPFTVAVSDGLDTTTFSFDLLIGSPPKPTNRPPNFVSEPVEGASVIFDYAYDVQVDDADGDPVVVQLVSAPPGMAFTQTSALRGRLTWSPGLYYPRGAEAYNWSFDISLRAWDRSNFTYQNYTLLLRNPPDERPIIGDFSDISLGPEDVRAIDLGLFATDADDNVTTLRWSIKQPADTQGAVIGFDTEDPFRLIVRAPAHIEGSHSFYINITVKDSSGRSDSRNVLVELHGPTTIEAAFPWLLLLVLVGGVGAAYALATRQRAGVLEEEGAVAPRGGPASGLAQTAVPAGDAGFPLYLEGAVLFDQSDNLIASASAGGGDLEEVFVLVPSLARALGPSEGTLRLAKVEGRDVALMGKGDARLAVLGLFAGDPSPWLEEPLRSTLEQVQARADELKVSDLDALSADPGVAEALKALLALGAGSSPEAVARYAREKSLRAASVVEHVQGFLRLKVAVDNESVELAADVRLSVEFDDKVLRLDRVEPAVDQRRDKFHLGNLRPGERKTVAFYFDPQICTRSFFNATVGWEDARGAFHSTAMRTRPAEVVCPAFSTPRQANTAMLRRLLQEELAFRDSKYFRFPTETSADQVFEACKQAVLAQDVRLVKEFVTERPYRAEAWFYGETKVKQSPMVIWTAVFGAERVAQFSCASNAHASITGLLAELGRRLVDSRAGGGVGAPIETMGKAVVAAEIGDRPTLLSKSQQGEIASGDGRAGGELREDRR